MRINKDLVKVLITIILFNISMDLMAGTLISARDVSSLHHESNAPIQNLYQDCDDARTSSCSSSIFIAIFNLYKFFAKHDIHNRNVHFSEVLYKITLDVPKPPPRFHYM